MQRWEVEELREDKKLNTVRDKIAFSYTEPQRPTDLTGKAKSCGTRSGMHITKEGTFWQLEQLFLRTAQGMEGNSGAAQAIRVGCLPLRW